MEKVNSFKEWLKEILANPVRIAFWVFVSSTFAVIVLTLSLKLYDLDFCKNVLVEAHGMLFDLLIIGLLILWLNEKGKKQVTIQRYENEIDDFRGWESEEAARRIRGNIIRLNKEGVCSINLEGCFLKSMKLDNVNLQGAFLNSANLQGASLRRANLQQAWLIDTKLQKTILHTTDLQGATLEGANLKGASLYHANLHGCILMKADLEGATGLTIEQVSNAKTLYGVTGLDSVLMEQIKKDYPHHLEEP